MTHRWVTRTADYSPVTHRWAQRRQRVKGIWKVKKTESGTVWCDASNMGLGVVVEIGGCIAEDSAWLRKKDDYHHINVAELDSVLKGLNLAIKWNLCDITLITDSATVASWLNLTISGERSIRTMGAAEIVVKRRFGIFKTLIEELCLTITVKLVPSEPQLALVLGLGLS